MRKDFWNDSNNLYKLQPLSNEAIKQVEQKLNVKLPESYLNILKQQNGGLINYSSHASNTPTADANNYIIIEYLYGIGENNGILDTEYLIEEWDLPEKIVIISGEGHSWLALDYRNIKENPPVIYIDVDRDQIFEIASNFEVFLDGLINHKESELDIIEDDLIQEKYLRGELSDQEMRKIISAQVRKGRTNNEIMASIDAVVNNGAPKKVNDLFDELLGLCDEEIEKHMINQIKYHKSIKVKANLGSYLLACAMGNNKVLDMQFVKNTLVDMKDNKNTQVSFYVKAALEFLENI